MNNPLKLLFVGFITILAISLLTLYPSFNLALFGDDWLAFFRYKQHVDPGSGQWNHLTYYLTPYGAQDITMGLLYKIYGFNSTYYYITSYVLRLIAAFSLIPLVYYLTKDKLSAFFVALFFSVTATGFDATNWVFNMPVYITISLFFLSLYFFISAREKEGKKRLLISAVLYYLSYITAPIRMHGSLPFLFLIEVFWFIQNRNTKTFKSALFRFAIMFLVFLIVRFAGQSQGPAIEASERFLIGINTSQGLLAQGRFDFIFYPFVMIGSMLIPDLLLTGSSITSYKQIALFVIPIFLISTLLITIFLRFIDKLKKRFYLNLFLSLTLWTFITSVITKGNTPTFGNSNLITLLLISGYALILAVYLLFSYFKEKKTSTLLFLSLSWTLFSFFFAWWWIPTSIFPTTYRYLIVPAVGIALFFSGLIGLGKDRSTRLLLFLLFIPFIFINILTTRLYLDQLTISHGQKVSEEIWASIPHIPEITTTNKPFIFYFEGDGTNGGILHNVITFGFPPHMALIYGLTAEDPLPVPMSDFKEVISAVTDGKTMPAYGYKAEAIDINQIYAFHLSGQRLVNITDQARQKLKEISFQSSVK